MNGPLYFRYWGKASKEDGPTAAFHLLPYHCLDVAAVGSAWWTRSGVIRCMFSRLLPESYSQAWLMFFLALHDFGKFDLRFQAKAADVLVNLQPDTTLPPTNVIQQYSHGPAGFAWFVEEKERLLKRNLSSASAEAWFSWLAPVAGHHGSIPPYGDDRINARRILPLTDYTARADWFRFLEALFLHPAGLSLADDPPQLTEGMKAFFAGFCSVCDWLGSNSAPGLFEYCSAHQPLDLYFQNRLTTAERVLDFAGVYNIPLRVGGFAALYAPRYQPRQLQTQVDNILLGPGLTLFEAPTGSGKTEAALAYASRLLAANIAESIIFALPTQATANAMLDRLEKIATKLYPHGSNIILAHGKARYNPNFDELRARANASNVQGKENATVHCAEWLAASRKRVFLGQIGVCTVDQVLLSVLPVKHSFVRSFGLGKSVLVVDEVHAYDSYMLGLLCEVLARQRQAGGSAILLSATLPSAQRDLLIEAWEGSSCSRDMAQGARSIDDYPLITCISKSGGLATFRIASEHRPPPRRVGIELRALSNLLPDDVLMNELIDAARRGAKVAVICNVVADAQALAKQLRERVSDNPVDIFHSRYRFIDRQNKEQEVLKHYGEKRPAGGRILVATQVVEQSLNLDFDWLVTQLCPMDLLFQRIGRLHRYHRLRPKGFKELRCTVLVPTGESYGYAQETVYCKAILWRTERLLQGQATFEFPNAYRPLIEKVYQEESWEDEPEPISKALDDHLGQAIAMRSEARRLSNTIINPFDDDADKIRAFTRSGEQGPNVLLLTADERAPLFQPNVILDQLPEWDQQEIFDMESVPVPNSWRGSLPPAENHRVRLAMHETALGRFEVELRNALYIYDRDLGLRKEKKEAP